MYRIEDKTMAILEVQRYLFLISDENPDRLQIAQDGIYTEETSRSVKEFQSVYGISPSGIVDRITFDKIYEEYSKIREKRKINAHNNLGEFNFRLGDFGTEVSILNSLLFALSEFYKDIPKVREDSFFSRATEEAVKYIQSIFGVAEDGTVDSALYARINDELNARRRFKV